MNISIIYTAPTLSDFLAALDAMKERGIPCHAAPSAPASALQAKGDDDHGPMVSEYLRRTGGQRWRRRAGEIEQGLDDESAAAARLDTLPPDSETPSVQAGGAAGGIEIDESDI
jgi:hypothetical protein